MKAVKRIGSGLKLSNSKIKTRTGKKKYKLANKVISTKQFLKIP